MRKIPVDPLAVNPRDAARLAGISRSRVYDLIDEGELPAFNDGRRRLILVADIEARLNRLKAASRPKPTGPLLPAEDQALALKRAAPDFAAAYAERVKLLARDLDEAEARARGFDFTVALYQAHHKVGLKAAKTAVLAAVKRSAAP